jgi:hypothetical protein
MDIDWDKETPEDVVSKLWDEYKKVIDNVIVAKDKYGSIYSIGYGFAEIDQVIEKVDNIGGGYEDYDYDQIEENVSGIEYHLENIKGDK